MTLSEKIIKTTIDKIDNPCLYYNKVYKWYQANEISQDIWDEFVMACLKSLMEKNKNVLDRLKNE